MKRRACKKKTVYMNISISQGGREGHVDISTSPSSCKHAGTLCPKPFVNYISEGSISCQHVVLEDVYNDRTAKPNAVVMSTCL